LIVIIYLIFIKRFEDGKTIRKALKIIYTGKPLSAILSENHLSIIFLFLDEVSVCNCYITCKYWNKIMKKSTWEKFWLTIFKSNLPKIFEK